MPPRTWGLAALRSPHGCYFRPDTSPGQRIPIVALTANAMKDDDVKCRAAGMDDHLSKPLDRERLARCLALHLAAVG